MPTEKFVEDLLIKHNIPYRHNITITDNTNCPVLQFDFIIPGAIIECKTGIIPKKYIKIYTQIKYQIDRFIKNISKDTIIFVYVDDYSTIKNINNFKKNNPELYSNVHPVIDPTNILNFYKTKIENIEYFVDKNKIFYFDNFCKLVQKNKIIINPSISKLDWLQHLKYLNSYTYIIADIKIDDKRYNKNYQIKKTKFSKLRFEFV